MSNHPQQPPYPPPPGKPRPRAWWFAGPVLLLVAAVAVFVIGLITTIGSVEIPDQRFAADGAPLTAEVTAGETQGIWVRGEDLSGFVNCAVTQGGAPVEVSTPGVDFTVNSWTLASEFEPSSNSVEVSCVAANPSLELAVGDTADGGQFALGLVATIIAPLVLGGIAVIWLIVLGILFATRPKRTA